MGKKFEYHVMQSPRRYTWEIPFFYVERRAPGGTWATIPGLSQAEKQSISDSCRYGNDKEKAIVRAKQILRKNNRFNRGPKIRYTLAFYTLENQEKGQYLTVSNWQAYWHRNSPLREKLEHYKGIKKFYTKNPFYVECTTATIDGSYNIEKTEQRRLTADLSRPFLLAQRCDW